MRKKALILGSILLLVGGALFACDFKQNSIINESFINTYNFKNDEIKGFKNTVNAKYEKVYYSKLIKNEYSDDDLKKLCYKNYIKLVIDIKYEWNTILNLTERLRNFKPNSVEIDYLISLTNDVIAESSTDMVKSSTKDNYTYTVDYIKQIYPDIAKINESIKNIIENKEGKIKSQVTCYRIFLLFHALFKGYILFLLL